MTEDIKDTLYSVLTKVLKDFEGFSSKPYWDIKQWSWGYGTRVPNSSSTKAIPPTVKIITTLQAVDYMNQHLQNDKVILEKMISFKLNSNQLAALLLLSYNLGITDGKKMALLINFSDTDTIKNTWLSWYHVKKTSEYTPEQHAKIENSVKNRRLKEWELFNKKID